MLKTELDLSKSSGVDIDFLKRGGAINLDVLNANVKQILEREYREDVLKLPKLFQQVGSPSLQLPSSNRYRHAFRYFVDSNERRVKSSKYSFKQNNL